jgi:hypothetical protein
MAVIRTFFAILILPISFMSIPDIRTIDFISEEARQCVTDTTDFAQQYLVLR